ncbi:hypothetical protein DCC85_04415 [Paenibacillus sp. CAA11]|uniref:sensor histidine kinase n=1 Tax=Paenibacillus sp. CAA11 TaxID=1532905 RepID=UPI000D346DA2|nr:ATP-binding protein [Paenibacillus sp. CAA11]AWB43541.1 hypothetical protein DCC85_04415 [Paenibacillus sp. CAA11]
MNRLQRGTVALFTLTIIAALYFVLTADFSNLSAAFIHTVIPVIVQLLLGMIGVWLYARNSLDHSAAAASGVLTAAGLVILSGPVRKEVPLAWPIYESALLSIPWLLLIWVRFRSSSVFHTAVRVKWLLAAVSIGSFAWLGAAGMNQAGLLSENDLIWLGIHWDANLEYTCLGLTLVGCLLWLRPLKLTVLLLLMHMGIFFLIDLPPLLLHAVWPIPYVPLIHACAFFMAVAGLEQIEQVLKEDSWRRTLRQHVSAMAAALLASIGLSLVNALIWGDRLSLGDYGLMALLSAVFLLLLQIVMIKIKGWTHLYTAEGRWQMDRLTSFGDRLAGAQNTAKLDALIVEEACSALNMPKLALIEYDTCSDRLSLRAGDVHLLQSGLYRWLPFELENYAYTELTDRRYLQFTHHGTIHLFLVIDKPVGSRTLSHSKRQYLQSMAVYASIAYEKQLLIEGLAVELDNVLKNQPELSPRVTRLAFTISERERRKLSLELHDSALQEQLHWYRQLQSILERGNHNGLREGLEEIGEGMLDVIHQIREICTDLRPLLVPERGLVEALNGLMRRIQLRSDLVIHLDYGLHNVGLPEEEIITLYRILQELLNNTLKHSGAHAVVIELFTEGELLCLCYSDDGQGMDWDEVEASGEHMGLTGIRERVAGLEGQAEIWSRPEGGFCFKMSFRSRRARAIN